MNIITILLALSSLAAAAPQQPIYMSKVPETICTPIANIDENMQTCEDNKILLERAKKCADSFQALRNDVTKQAVARFQKDTGAQQKNFSANKADNEEAVRAHDYLIKVGDRVAQELDSYFDYLEHPEVGEGDESDDEIDAMIWNTGCYRENAEAMDEIVDRIENQVEEMKASKSMEAFNSTVSGGRHTNINAITPAQIPSASAAGKGSGAVIPKGKSSKGASDITGTREDKDKRSKTK